jgi:hypothetical protein
MPRAGARNAHTIRGRLDHRRIDQLENVNPFALPDEDRADVVLIESHWHRVAAAQHPERIGQAMRSLERHADVLVGLDADQFMLGFPPAALERLVS